MEHDTKTRMLYQMQDHLPAVPGANVTQALP